MREIDHSAHPEQNVPAPDTTSHSIPSQSHPVMLDRPTVVSYLQTVRNLEAMKRWLFNQRYNIEPTQARERIKQAQQPNYAVVPPMPSKSPLFCFLACVALFIILAVVIPSAITIILAVISVLSFIGYCYFRNRQVKEIREA